MANQNIEINRDAVEAAIAKLRRERGEAVLDGQRFDDSKIAQAEAELAAFSDAQAARIARQREQEAKDAAANVKAKIKRIAELEQKRLVAWADLEAATRAQLKAIGNVISSTESERVLMNDVTAAVPMALGPFENAHRLRGRIGEFLHAAKINFEVPGAGGIYGQAPLQDWREAERKELGSFISALLEECENGEDN